MCLVLDSVSCCSMEARWGFNISSWDIRARFAAKDSACLSSVLFVVVVVFIHIGIFS